MAQQQAEIRQALDWIFASNFNFISTEAGSTEFTHPSCTVMLAWMNYVTEYVWIEFSLIPSYKFRRFLFSCLSL